MHPTMQARGSCASQGAPASDLLVGCMRPTKPVAGVHTALHCASATCSDCSSMLNTMTGSVGL